MSFIYSKIQSLQNINFKYSSVKKLNEKINIPRMFASALVTGNVIGNVSDVNLVHLDKPAEYTKIFKIEEKKYQTKMAEEAAQFLKRNINFGMAFSYIEMKVMEYFNNPVLFLEVTEEKIFLLTIGINDTPENALKKLWKFDDEWWLENKKLTAGKLCIDVVTYE